jgi:hypothetical protein
LGGKKGIKYEIPEDRAKERDERVSIPTRLVAKGDIKTHRVKKTTQAWRKSMRKDEDENKFVSDPMQ